MYQNRCQNRYQNRYQNRHSLVHPVEQEPDTSPLQLNRAFSLASRRNSLHPFFQTRRHGLVLVTALPDGHDAIVDSGRPSLRDFPAQSAAPDACLAMGTGPVDEAKEDAGEGGGG